MLLALGGILGRGDTCAREMSNKCLPNASARSAPEELAPTDLRGERDRSAFSAAKLCNKRSPAPPRLKAASSLGDMSKSPTLEMAQLGGTGEALNLWQMPLPMSS